MLLCYRTNGKIFSYGKQIFRKFVVCIDSEDSKRLLVVENKSETGVKAPIRKVI